MDSRPGGSPTPDTAVTAALVCVGCFLGAGADVMLRFPGVGAAILFAPYAIVTAALWRSPPRTWWIILVAASVGNFLPHRFGGASVAFVLMTEAVNHLRAVLAAIALRHFAGRSSRFDTLRGIVGHLVFAVFLAPSVSAFAGAGLVVWRGTTGVFWLAWREWALSNALTGLTLLPLLMFDLGPIVRRPRIDARRALEASLLVLGLVVVGAVVFTGFYNRSSVHPARLYWPLPFLLWAAVRFGPKATSAALLVVTSLSVWGAMERRGPFAAEMPVDNLLDLQLFLLAVSVPVLLLSALLKQQRNTAAALLESQRQYQSVVEDQTEMICRFRPVGTYTFVNGAYCKAFGRAAHDLVGRSIWGVGPQGVHRSFQDLVETITPASPIATREISLSIEGQGTRWQQWRDRGFFDGRGLVVEYQSVGRDVTDRKQAEDERRELEARRSVEAALRDNDRRKDEFIAMLGHELRNPLASIAVALEINRRGPPQNREATWATETIGRHTRHLTRLVDDLLDISRIALGKIRLNAELTDLASVVANAVDATRPLIDSQGHRLTVEVPDGPVPVQGDAVRLTQVVANLLNNATKYTEPGGHIEVSLREQPDAALLSVRDNGIGIAPDSLGSIFELFTQIPAGRAQAGGGLGIGLTLVKRLVEMHGGSVRASSAGEGHGSEFVLRLPLVEDVVRVEATTAPETPRSQIVRRVLIADDNADAAEGLRQLLELQSHDVEVVHDGAQALEAISRRDPDVVLLDIGLPILDGLEVARKIRERGGVHRPLLVAITGLGQPEDRRRTAAAGFDHHLVKPIDFPLLEDLLAGDMQ